MEPAIHVRSVRIVRKNRWVAVKIGVTDERQTGGMWHGSTAAEMEFVPLQGEGLDASKFDETELKRISSGTAKELLEHLEVMLKWDVASIQTGRGSC